MQKKYPFTGKVRYKNKSYEAEYNMAKESLTKANLTLIAQNETIRSKERIIAELQEKNRKQMETIKYLRNVINGDKKPIKIIPFEKTEIENLYKEISQRKPHPKSDKKRNRLI